MLFRSRRAADPFGLKPFVLKTHDGFLIGMGMDPKVGAPCAQCVQFWLQDREVFAEPIPLASLTLRRDLIVELIEQQSTDTLYEITLQGDATRLEGPVFPHPRCDCAKGQYAGKGEWDKKSCFAFSPISKLSAARYATSDGNVWVTQAEGNAPLSDKKISVSGTGATKESSRLSSVDTWLKEAARADLRARSPIAEENFQRPSDSVKPIFGSVNYFESYGAGESKESATLDALFGLTKQITLRRFSNSGKNPMLVVGVNNWLRGKVPFFVLQQFDLHLLFYPNSFPCWVVGVVAFSRVRSDEKPIFMFGAHSAIHKAIDAAFGKVLQFCSADADLSPGTERDERGAQRVLWWTNWLYRCPKLSLKDVLQLEAYEPSVELWRSYLQDGQPTVGALELNHPSLPADLRRIVRLRMPRTESEGRSIGIATWADFHEVTKV